MMELVVSHFMLHYDITADDSRRGYLLQMEDMQRELVDIKEDGTAGEQRHKEEVNRLRAERERTKKEHATQTDELLQRLQNACAQRDEAREQVLCYRFKLSRAGFPSPCSAFC